jgi:hypothetical protein
MGKKRILLNSPPALAPGSDGPALDVHVPGDKPRQTRSDRWKERPVVLRYRAWADLVRAEVTGDPTKKLNGEDFFGIVAFFHCPIPGSWSAVEKAAHAGRLHRGRGDTDNRIKGLLDALFDEDKYITIHHGFKFWCEEGSVPRTDFFLLAL